MVELIAAEAVRKRTQPAPGPSTATGSDHDIEIVLDARIAFYRDFEIAAAPDEQEVLKSDASPEPAEGATQPETTIETEPSVEKAPAATGVAAAAILVSGIEARTGRSTFLQRKPKALAFKKLGFQLGNR